MNKIRLAHIPMLITCSFLIFSVGCSGTPTKETIVNRIKNASGDSKWDSLNDETMACYTSEENLIKAVGKPDSRIKTGDDPSDEKWTWRCSDGVVDVPVGGITTKQVTIWKYEINTY